MKKLLFTVFLLATFICSMLPFPQPVLAQTGSISGYVYESGTTNGIEGATVSAYTYAPDLLPLWAPDGQATTDENGHYEITDLPEGNYRVAAIAPNYERIIYPDKHLLTEGDQVTVPSENINFYLGPGGTISGTVTGDDGVSAIPDVSVVATLSNTKGAYCIGLTDGSGNYILDGLPYGSYAVMSPGVSKLGSGDDGYIMEYWQDKLLGEPPDLVDINSGQTLVENIDFTLTVGGTISGYVHETDGTTPIANAMVQVFIYESLNSGWILRGVGITESDGHYQTTGLPAGQYGLRAMAPASNYASEWYLETPYKDNATSVPVTVPGDTSGKDFTLEVGGAISGIVTDESQNTIGNCHVYVSDYDTDMWVNGINTMGDGTYVLTGLPVGSYRVRALPENTGLPYASEYYNNTYNHGQAQAVVVNSGQTKTDINFELAPGGTISGTVYGDSDDPVANVSVECMRDTDGYEAWWHGTTTNEQGDYTLAGLPYGDYWVRAPGGSRWGSGDGNYILQYYNQHLLDVTPDDVTISSESSNQTGINFYLTTGDSISGKVTDESGSPNPIANCHVYAEEALSHIWLSGTYTDSNGDYTLFGLIPGTDLRLKAAPSKTGLPYADEYYDGAYMYYDATPVQAPDTGINFTLGPPLNNIWAGFFTSYNYNVDGDSYTYDSESPISGNKGWSSHLHNPSDNTGESVVNPILKLSGPDDFDWMNAWPEYDSYNYDGNTHWWYFYDLNEDNGMGVDVGYNTPVSFNPPFDITRSIEPLTLSGNQYDVIPQTLTVTVIPKAAMNQMNINVNTQDNELISSVVTSISYSVGGVPGPVEGVDTDYGNNYANLSVPNPETDTVYIFTVNIDVTLQGNFTSIEHMPWIQVTKQTNQGGGTSDASCTWEMFNEVGVWQWLATGIYTWNMGVFEHENVVFNGTQYDNAWAGFNTNYNYHISGDSFSSQQVTGEKGWGINTKSKNGFTSLMVNLNSSLTFEGMNPTPTTSDPPNYEWYFGDIQGTNVDVGLGADTIDFTPGFNVVREINPRTLTADGDQTLTIYVTPLEAMDGLSIHVNVNEDNLMIPTITTGSVSPDPGADIWISPDGKDLNINVQNPTVSQTYTYTVTIHVDLKEGVSSVEHMPWVNVNQSNNITGGTVTGSGVAHTITGMGDWTIAATGTYVWDWGEFLNKSVQLEGTKPNNAWVSFGTNYKYNMSGDSFTSQQVIGFKGWGVNPKAENGFTSLMVALNSSLTFEWMNPTPTSSSPPNYQWYFGDIQGTNVDVGSSTYTIDFTPGFNVTRDITPRTLTADGDQTLTIEVTPLEAMDGLDINVNVNEDNLIIPTITTGSVSPDPGANIWISPDGKNLNIHIQNPTVSQTYTYTVTIYVDLKEGVGSVEHMPWVNINQSNNITNGTDTGSEVSHTITGMGDWTIAATGTYVWDWGEFLNKSVQLQGTQFNNAWVGFNTNCGYVISGDSFTSHQVSGWKDWGTDAKSENEFTSLIIALNSGLPFEWMNPTPTSSDPPVYTWSFGNVQGYGVNVGSGAFTVDYTPGFDVTRDITPRILTADGDQTLTIEVTPLEAMDGLGISVHVKEDSLIIPTITTGSVSPDPGADIWISPDGKDININMQNPTVGQTYTYTVNIYVDLKEGISSVEHMPWVHVNQSNNIAKATVTGSEVSRTITGMGDWTISSTGTYVWNWGEFLNKSIHFEGGIVCPDLTIVEKHEEWVQGQEGIQYTVHYTVKNVGTATAASGHITRLMVDGQLRELKPVPIPLNPGEDYSDSFNTILTLTDGLDMVTVMADSNGDILESDEGNNGRSNSISWPPKPDLTVYKWEEWVGEAGTSYVVHYTVRNQGNAPAPAGHDLRLEVDKSIVETQTINIILNPGQEYNGTFGQLTLSEGVDSINVRIDINQEIDESREDNNNIENTLSWPAKPDLIVIMKSENWVEEGSNQYTVQFVIRNIGNAPAPAGSDVAIIVDGVEVQQIEVTSDLSPNQIFVGFTNAITLSGSLDEISVVADCNSEVTESIENNNGRANLWPENMTYVGMIMTGEQYPFFDVRVRQAIYLALDREVIGMAMGGKTVLSIVMPPVMNPNVCLPYNPQMAKNLLTASGYSNGFQTDLYTTPALYELSFAIKCFLADIGIDATITVLNPAVFISQLESAQFGLFVTAEPVGNWSQTPQILGNLLLSTGSSNYTGYSNADFDTQYNSGAWLAAENTAFSTENGLAIVPLFWSSKPPQQTGDYTDLVVSEKHEEWLIEGKVYTVHYTVKNTGLVNVPAGHNVSLIVDGQEREKKQVPVSLAPGEEYNGSFNSAIILTDGFDLIQIRADADGAIPEKDEGNNNRMNILSWTPKPDLTVSKWEEWVGEAGTSYIVYYNVQNRGNAPANAGYDLTLMIDGTVVETKQITVTLGPGEETSGAFTQRSLEAGVDTIIVNVDTSNEITESIEDNNYQWNTLAWPAAPDLAIVHKVESWVPGQEGTQYNVRFFVRNIGNAPAPAGHDVSISVDGSVVQTIEVTYDLQPGQTFVGFSDPITLSDNEDIIHVCADCNAEVDESDEIANCLNNNWGITTPPNLPDLKVTKSESWTNEEAAAYSLDVHVENVGSQPLAGGFAIDVMIDRVLQETMHTEYTNDFAVDSFFDVSFDIDLTDASDEIIVTVAPLQAVEEITENNNTVINTWGRPDLIISAMHEEWVNDANHAEGYRVYFTIQNIGAGIAHSAIGEGLVGIDVGMTINGDPIQVENQVTLPGDLEPGATFDGFFDVILPTPEGTLNDEIIVTVDVNQECIESNEANNSRPSLWPTYTMTYLGMNVSVGPNPFAAVKVRQAVYLSLDRDTIDNIITGSAKVQSIVTPLTANPNVNLNYDPNQAKALLADAGYPNGFKTDLYVPSLPNLVDVALAVKGYLADIGIDAQIQVLEPGAFMSRFFAHNMGFFLTGAGVWWAHPEDVLGKMLLSTSPANATQYNNSTFDNQFNSGLFLDAENTAFSTTDGLAIVPLFWSVSPPVVPLVDVVVNAPARVPPDHYFSVPIEIGEVSELNAVQFDITFANTVLEWQEPGNGQIGTRVIELGDEMSVNQITDPAPPEGYSTYRFVISFGLGSISGSGTLAVLNFHSTGGIGSTSEIIITNGILSSMSGEIIADWISDFVEISVIPGDANDDGVINVLDMTKVAREILQLDPETPGADANLDGVVNVLDITKIARIILQLDPQ